MSTCSSSLPSWPWSIPGHNLSWTSPRLGKCSMNHIVHSNHWRSSFPHLKWLIMNPSDRDFPLNICLGIVDINRSGLYRDKLHTSILMVMAGLALEFERTLNTISLLGIQMIPPPSNGRFMLTGWFLDDLKVEFSVSQ